MQKIESKETDRVPYDVPELRYLFGNKKNDALLNAEFSELAKLNDSDLPTEEKDKKALEIEKRIEQKSNDAAKEYGELHGKDIEFYINDCMRIVSCVTIADCEHYYMSWNVEELAPENKALAVAFSFEDLLYDFIEIPYSILGFLLPQGVITGRVGSKGHYVDIQEDKAPDDTIGKMLADLKVTIRKKAISLSYELPELIKPQLSTKQLKDVTFPLDKVTRNAFNMTEEDFAVFLESGMDCKTSKENLVHFEMDLTALGDDAQIMGKLVPYDRKVHNAVISFLFAGRNIVTPGQIYAAMGYSGNPPQSHIDDIVKSLRKMRGIGVVIDVGKDYGMPEGFSNKIESSMLSWERQTVSFKGKQFDAIKFAYEEKGGKIISCPPLMRYAIAKKQYATIPAVVYKLPMRKTETVICLEEYILWYYERNKKKGKVTMLFDTIAQELHIDRSSQAGRKSFSRLPEKVECMLSHYKSIGFISNYVIASDRVIITP